MKLDRWTVLELIDIVAGTVFGIIIFWVLCAGFLSVLSVVTHHWRMVFGN